MGKPVKISEDLYRKVEELAQRTGKSIKEVVEDALAKYFGLVEGLESDSDIKDVKVVKNWKLRYNATCSYCKKEMKAGEEAVREVVELEDGRKINNFYHPECYVYSTDSALAKTYVKKRMMERLIRALKKEADRLADAINEAEVRKKVLDIANELQRAREDLRREIAKVDSLVDRYITNPEDREEVKRELRKLNEKVDEYAKRIEELASKLEEVAIAMRIKLQPKGRRYRRRWYDEEAT